MLDRHASAADRDDRAPFARSYAAPVSGPPPHPAGPRPAPGRLVARSAAFQNALGRVERYARHDRAPVLIEGESGSGKTSLARHLHRASPRGAGTFEHVDLGALDDALAGSDLFGHLAGAFTGARQSRRGHVLSASGGTLFLDEIGKASLAVQRKLLHVVEYGEIVPLGADRAIPVDVRMVFATNVPLETLVERGEFLFDLKPRLGLLTVKVPPLRERREDIPDLVRQCVERHAPQCGYGDGEVPAVDADLMRALERAPWPDNLRQLDATMLRLLLEACGAMALTLELCEDELAYLRAVAACGRPVELTAELVREAVGRAAGNITQAALALGVARTTIHRYLRKDGLGDGGARGE